MRLFCTAVNFILKPSQTILLYLLAPYKVGQSYALSKNNLPFMVSIGLNKPAETSVKSCDNNCQAFFKIYLWTMRLFNQKQLMYKYWLAALLFSGLTACGGGGNSEKALPQSIGGEYEIVVVVDDELTDAPHVVALKEVLTQNYPMLNQNEPWFTLSWIDVDNVNYLTEKNRNLILLTNRDTYGKVRQMGREIFGDEAVDALEQDPNKFMLIGKDAWVRPQNIMYLADENANLLAEKIKANE
ncbi:DUF4837 family protein, partial [bacterium]|nr:DUF4837 family protein [bacterium]